MNPSADFDMVALLRAIRYNRTIRGNVMMDSELSYAEFGAGSPLVLLHGNGEDRNYFEAQISPFATRYRVIAVDTRGHGQSPRGSAPFTLSQFVDDLWFPDRAKPVGRGKSCLARCPRSDSNQHALAGNRF